MRTICDVGGKDGLEVLTRHDMSRVFRAFDGIVISLCIVLRFIFYVCSSFRKFGLYDLCIHISTNEYFVSSLLRWS